MAKKREGKGHVLEGLAVRRDPVGRPEKNDGMELGAVDRAVDLGEETDAVPHGDPMLGFPVMPLEIALAVAGRGGIGLGVVQVRFFKARRVHLRRLVDDPESRVAPLLVFRENEMKGPLFLGNLGEFQLFPFDRVPRRRFGFAGLDGPERSVLEIHLEDERPLSGHGQLVDARDLGVLDRDIVRPVLQKRAAREEEYDCERSGCQAEEAAELGGHGDLLAGFFHFEGRTALSKGSAKRGLRRTAAASGGMGNAPGLTRTGEKSLSRKQRLL